MRRLVLGTVLLLTALIGWYVLAQAAPTPWAKPATVDGRIVTTTYVGSECQSYDRVDVDEDSERVVITVRETVLARGCSDVGVSYDVRVELDEPLGDRELLDGACLDPDLRNRPSCGGG